MITQHPSRLVAMTHQAANMSQSNEFPHQPVSFRFLQLPLELRDMVYSYAVVAPTPIYPIIVNRTATKESERPIATPLINVALLRANRQISREAL